jgi:hypothetical protein
MQRLRSGSLSRRQNTDRNRKLLPVLFRGKRRNVEKGGKGGKSGKVGPTLRLSDASARPPVRLSDCPPA